MIGWQRACRHKGWARLSATPPSGCSSPRLCEEGLLVCQRAFFFLPRSLSLVSFLCLSSPQPSWLLATSAGKDGGGRGALGGIETKDGRALAPRAVCLASSPSPEVAHRPSVSIVVLPCTGPFLSILAVGAPPFPSPRSCSSRSVLCRRPVGSRHRASPLQVVSCHCCRAIYPRWRRAWTSRCIAKTFLRTHYLAALLAGVMCVRRCRCCCASPAAIVVCLLLLQALPSPAVPRMAVAKPAHIPSSVALSDFQQHYSVNQTAKEATVRSLVWAWPGPMLTDAPASKYPTTHVR